MDEKLVTIELVLFPDVMVIPEGKDQLQPVAF